MTEEGIVFHVNEEEQWALLASPSSIGSGVEWGCKFVTTGAVGSALGEGASNTAMILEACDDPMAAARVASEYGDGWFLPSMDELGAIYEHVHAAGLGEYFVDNTYNWFWSSTECATDGTAAGDIWFQHGDAHACNNKDSNPGGVVAANRWTTRSAPTPTRFTWPWGPRRRCVVQEPCGTKPHTVASWLIRPTPTSTVASP